MEKPDEVGSDSEASEPLQYSSSKDKDKDSSSFSRKPSGDVVDRLLRQAWKRQKMLMELKEKDDEEFYRTNTFSPSISPYSKSLKHSEPVHERLFKIHRIQVAAAEEHEQEESTEEEKEEEPPNRTSMDPEELAAHIRKMELLYKDAEGRRQRQEKYLREVLQQEQLQREFKPLQRSHALLYKKFKKDFVNLLHSVAPNSNAEDSSSITIDKDTLAAVCYRLGLIKDEVPKDEDNQFIESLFNNCCTANGLAYKALSSFFKKVFLDHSEEFQSQPLTRNFKQRLRHHKFVKSPKPTADEKEAAKHKKRHSADSDQTDGRKRYELLYNKAAERQKKCEEKKEEMLKEEMKNCTFSPKIIQKQKQSEGTEKLKRSELLYNKSKQPKQQLSSTDAELKNCTFKPAINSPKQMKHSNAKVPNGFEHYVARIRQGNLEKNLIESQLNRSYKREYKRYTTPEPFSFQRTCTSPESKSPTPLFYLDVSLDPSTSHRIPVYPGFDPATVAQNFGKENQLSSTATKTLENVLSQLYIQHHV